MVKEIDLSSLPRFKDGRIDWKNSVGSSVRFKYENIEDEIKIVGFNDGTNVKKRLSIQYKDNPVFIINTYHFTQVKIGKAIKGKIPANYEVGEIVKLKYGDIEIINKKYIKGQGTQCTYKCKTCGYITTIPQSRIPSMKICSCCNGRIVIKEINSVWKLRPDLLKYFDNIEDSYSISPGSQMRVNLHCDICGTPKIMRMNDLSQDQFRCTHCSDGVSYPNKFIRYLLDDLNIKYELEKRFEWSIYKDADNHKRIKIYDIFIPDYKTIIEMHGIQHYSKVKQFHSLDYEQSNDKMKKELALQSGEIDHYIVIDCSKSSVDYISKNIENSELPSILNWKTQPDYIKIGTLASNNYILEASKLYNQGLTPYEIADVLKVHHATVYDYLNKGFELNLCEYEPHKKGRKAPTKEYVIHLETKNVYDNAVAANKQYSNSPSRDAILMNCNNETRYCHNKDGTYSHWMKYDDYLLATEDEINNKINQKMNHQDKLMKKIKCLETGEIFEGIKNAAAWCGLKSPSSINNYIKGRTSYAGTHPETGEPLTWVLI